MKKVYQKDTDIAHLWANQIQDEAKNPRNTFYFEGNTIYSYGSHFPISTIYKDKVLFTTDTYSSTTAKHIRIVQGAISHKDKISCNNPKDAANGWHGRNLESFIYKIENSLEGLAKAKKPEKYIAPANYWYQQCIIYCNFFEIEIPKKAIEIIEAVNTGEYKQYLIDKAEQLKVERKLQAERELAKFKEDLKEWKAGSNHNLWNNPDDYIYLRIKDEIIETSKGITIDLDQALTIYNRIKTNQINKLDTIQGYNVLAITQEYIKIGCHTIYFKEFENLMVENGYLK